MTAPADQPPHGESLAQEVALMLAEITQNQRTTLPQATPHALTLEVKIDPEVLPEGDVIIIHTPRMRTVAYNAVHRILDKIAAKRPESVFLIVEDNTWEFDTLTEAQMNEKGWYRR